MVADLKSWLRSGRRRPGRDFQAELYVGPQIVIIALLLIAQILVFLSDLENRAAVHWQIVYFAICFYALAGLAWWTGRGAGTWRPRAASWVIVCGITGLVFLGNYWLAAPGFLMLVSLPVLLAATMIGLPAATVIAVGATLLLLLLPPSFTSGAPAPLMLTVLVVIWGTWGLTRALYTHLYAVTDWSWQYARQAAALMAEAKTRKITLAQALDDLAHANQQLTRLNVWAEAMRRTAEDARTAKAEFVSNVSHELRTPLNMITGFTEMILGSPQTYGDQIPPTLLADLAVIQRNAQHLAELIDDVLDLSQVDTDQMALTKEQVRFQDIVDEAATAVQPLFDSKRLYLHLALPDDLPPVFCDRTRIREVILNLLSNAGRFTERGGVRLRVWLEGVNLFVSVADTGMGIAPDAQQRLFQPFQQADGTIRRRFGGAGLGLSISKRFVELHEGEIWVESQEEIGTTITFRFPIRPPAQVLDGYMRGIVPAWEYAQRTSPSINLKVAVPPRFVLLEAGDALRRLLTRYWDGAELVPVQTMTQACAELANHPAQALLINDVSMSEALKRLKAPPALPENTPAIICSIPGADDLSDCPGAAIRLVKPIGQEALLAALDRLGVHEGSVLIVDDEPDALQLFGRILSSQGGRYRVLLARDGAEALTILRERRPAVMLLDLVMPNVDGFQLLEICAGDPALREIPIVIISARDPLGRPIVSSALAVTQRGGLSVPQLLAGIEALSRGLSVVSRDGAPGVAETPPG